MISILSAFGNFNPNSPLIYGLYGAVVVFVVAMSLYYIVRSVRRAKALKMDMGKIKKVVTTSVAFSVLPAIGIGIGVVTLIGSIGIALPAIRLSVIGSLQYETMMADGAASAIAGSMEEFIGSNFNITAQDFVTIATVMTIPILTGPLVVIFFYKKFQPKVQMLSSMTSSTSGGGVNIGDLAFQVVFIGMILGYLAMSITTIASGAGYLDNYYNFIAIVIAAVCMYVLDLLINKAGWKWLDSFSTPFSMLIAMAVVAVISYFSYENGWPLAPDTDAAAAVVSAFM